MTSEEKEGRKCWRKQWRESEKTESGGVVVVGSVAYCCICGTDLIRLGPAVMKERVQAVPLLG